jgi:hypothetical protein
VSAGDRLHFSLIGGSVVVHRHASGAFAMSAKRYVVLPAAYHTSLPQGGEDDGRTAR